MCDMCRTQSHSDQIALGGLEKKTIFQGIDKGHFSSALPETMDAVLTHITCARRFAEHMCGAVAQPLQLATAEITPFDTTTVLPAPVVQEPVWQHVEVLGAHRLWSGRPGPPAAQLAGRMTLLLAGYSAGLRLDWAVLPMWQCRSGTSGQSIALQCL